MPVTVSDLPASQMSRTVISFWVSVPVLSVQMTVVQPSVSTAERRLISALRLAMRCTPMARDSVTVGSSPSGTKATIMPMAKMKLSARSTPANDDGQEEEDAAHGDGDDRDELRHALHLLLQRAGLIAEALGEVGDLAELGLHAGGEDDRLAGAGDDTGAREDQVGHFDAGEASVP